MEIASTSGNNSEMPKRLLITFSACALNRLLFWRYSQHRREIMESHREFGERKLGKTQREGERNRRGRGRRHRSRWKRKHTKLGKWIHSAAVKLDITLFKATATEDTLTYFLEVGK